ncbi:hypothetical protein JI739_22625 [Ramlibacter sp. AW1]|uniref:Uncharacterized protein n=1 Tax=Ramlibacter aurantiacus TaxID=2801330 RepID=A0A936ZMZ6_9BURK|nr:hypothetical protein [Ramlibacter aurantiacus]MBL0423148.1 hypothetical protein [Ramlibacter aurantiacus]
MRPPEQAHAVQPVSSTESTPVEDAQPVNAGLSPDLRDGWAPGEWPLEAADPESGVARPGAAPLPSRAASWYAALSAGTWAAVRELGAQGAGALVGVAVRSGIAGAGPVAAAATGTLAAAALGVAAYRAATLIAACAYPHREAPMPLRAALIAAPVLAAVAGVSCAAGTGALLTAGAYLTGKLVQRCVRDFLSTAAADLVPSSEIIDAQGALVGKSELALEDWGRSIGNLAPSTVFFVLQDVFAPAPEAAAGVVAALPYVAATAFVEVGRSITGTLLTAAVSHDRGRRLQPKAAGGWTKLRANLASRKTLLQAADATAMRQSIGILGDTLAVVVGHREQALSRMIFKVLRSELKALGELRAPLVTRGQLALEQRRLIAAAPPASELPAVDVLGGNTGVSYPVEETLVLTIHLPPRSGPLEQSAYRQS